MKSTTAHISLVLIIAVLLWATGAPLFVAHAKASNLNNTSDTLSNSNNSSLSRHVIKFTNLTAIAPTKTIKFGLDPVTSSFTESYSGATSTDITLTAFSGATTTYSVVETCTSGNQVSEAGNYNNGTDENLTLTVCGGAPAIATSSIVILTVGAASTNLWANPSITSSYRITIGGTMTDAGETRVAILPNVVLTASINTSFTFTVSGTPTSTTLFGNNATSTNTSQNAALPFGTLASSTIASSTVLIQQMNVTTNARNGFSVTVQENQPPTSGAGAIISLFSNGATTSTPIPWVAPTATLDQYNTYSHFGITSDDVDENATGVNEFGTGSKWAGNIDTPRVVFSHSGPADGVTQNKGAAKIAYRIQITDLQPAGNDYTNTITYVATPTF